MFTPPTGLTDRRVVEALSSGWSIDADRIEYAPVGFGSYHWWVEAGERRWFATADDLDAKRSTASEPPDVPLMRLRAALETARALRESGLDFVIAPLPSASGDVIERVGARYVIAVYPEVIGESHGWGPYGSRSDRLAVVERLTVLHRAARAVAPGALVDDHSIVKRDELSDAFADLDSPWASGPFGELARQLLSQHADAVIAALDRYDRLAPVVGSRPERTVLTHGEPHPGNTITTTAGVVLIDWDTALIAPPERDLWSLVGEDPGVAEFYSDRTGIAVDSEALELYRLSWDLTEISLYIDDFRRSHGVDDDTRTAWAGLQCHLDPARWD